MFINTNYDIKVIQRLLKIDNAVINIQGIYNTYIHLCNDIINIHMSMNMHCWLTCSHG